MKDSGKAVSQWLLLSLLVAVGGLFIHELGHGLMAVLLGGRITYFEVMPGLELFPTLARHPWDGFVAWIGYDLPQATSFEGGVIALMGSGTTACLAALTLLGLVIIRPQGVLRSVWLATTLLLPLDIASYSTFPALGWRHWIIFGGTISEPLEGARAMGIPVGAFYFGLGLYLLALYGVLGYSGLRGRSLSRSPGVE